MKQEEIIETFVILGQNIKSYLNEDSTVRYFNKIKTAVNSSRINNSWFTEFFVNISLKSIESILQKELLEKYISNYKFSKKNPKKIAVIMAGNIPAVGFRDFLDVLLSANIFVGKLSSKDSNLIPCFAEILIEINPKFSDYIFFEEEFLKNFDAVIATGSNNSARYFNHYFGKYPSIIRSNRNSVAIIHKLDDTSNFENLGEDIFYYFGLGCRSVSKIYVPENFDLVGLIDAFNAFSYVAENTKYFNNYEYNKAIYLINKVKHLDNGFALFKEDSSIISPISVIHYEKYVHEDDLLKKLMLQKFNLQAIVSSKFVGEIFLKPGNSQFPKLTDFADNVDVLKFLSDL
ncbi:MAG: hypothetical protein AUJ98_07880 [Bacteroidetes bacterium CG2_30_33_31]|nr:MAG: hypothetical protein AUJ98_07880 [Bacteroidetes bacterium CG2_30_33_31]